MAVVMLRQYINGAWVNTISVDATADDLTALKSILEGKVEEWDSKASGGTKADLPDTLNPMRFAVGKDGGTYHSKKSCSFRVHHIKPDKTSEDVKTLVVGNFDARYDLDEKCEYCRLIADFR